MLQLIHKFPMIKIIGNYKNCQMTSIYDITRKHLVRLFHGAVSSSRQRRLKYLAGKPDSDQSRHKILPLHQQPVEPPLTSYHSITHQYTHHGLAASPPPATKSSQGIRQSHCWEKATGRKTSGVASGGLPGLKPRMVFVQPWTFWHQKNK